MCGEQKVVNRMMGMLEGSPPRVRGTDSTRQSRIYAVQITPACAGNRPTSSATSVTITDHPRVCGEQVLFHGFC